MNVLFRAEGKASGGLGHLVRCLTVAGALRRRHADQVPGITFLTDSDDLTLEMIARRGFRSLARSAHQREEAFLTAAVAEAGADVLVVDMLYPYSPEFIERLKSDIRIAVIFNSPQAITAPNVVVVPAAHLPDDIISGLSLKAKDDTRLYEGFDYVVISDEVRALQGREMSSTNHESLRIVITTGGSDPKGVLIRVLEWMRGYNRDSVEVWGLTGSAFQHREALARMQPTLPGNIHITDYDPASIVGADLAVCTFGITTYELMYLGIPSLCIGHAGPNTRGSAILARKYGATMNMGYIDDLSANEFLTTLGRYIQHADERRLLRDRGRTLMDGEGASRIAAIIYDLGWDTEPQAV